MLEHQAILKMTIGQLQAKYLLEGSAQMVRVAAIEPLRVCCWDAASFLTVGWMQDPRFQCRQQRKPGDPAFDGLVNAMGNGFDATKPIVLIEIGGKIYVCDGHHRRAAAELKGLTEVPAHFLKPDTPVDVIMRYCSLANMVSGNSVATTTADLCRRTIEVNSFLER